MQQVTMPQLGETVIEGTVTRWLKAEGDEVAVDEPLYEVSTDKVDTEVPSAHAGVIRSLLVAEGDTVPVGALLALIGAADEVIDLTVETGEIHEPAAATTDPAAGPAAAPPMPSSHRPASMRPTRSSDASASVRSTLSPVVLRLLDEHGLRADQVRGSGRDGRITRADVLAAAANRAGATSETGGVASVAQPVPQPAEGDEIVPFTSARRATAEHLRRSLDTSAHAFVATEVDYAALEGVRAEVGTSYLAFVARAAVDALGEFRLLNASVGDDCVIVHPAVHLGLAVDVAGEALLVPVVRDAGGLRLRALAAAFTGVAERARQHRLGTDEITGATFTLTNVGAHGTLLAVPIINQPQVAILSTDGVRPRPVATATTGGEWAVTVHPVGNLSLSFDHRAVDGAYAAAFLARVRTTLEQRDWAAEA